MGRMLAQGRTPKHVGLARRLLRRIEDSKLEAGDRLGTELELARAHGVSRMTLRQALAVLEKDGFISRRKAKGTFVRRSLVNGWHLGLARGTVVVICSNEQVSHADEDLGFASVLRGLERGLAKSGFAVQIMGVGEDPEEDRHRLGALTHRTDVEGVCAIGPCLESYCDAIPSLPIVAVSGYFADSLFPLVNMDLATVSRSCTEHLLRNGHRKIALICGSWVAPAGFRLFAEGYRQAHAAAGQPFCRNLMYHGYPEESLNELCNDAISGPLKPTAVFAENWRICKRVIVVAAERGLSIPDDLSVVAYGQNVLQLASPVAITTYVPDSHVIGERAAHLLAGIIDGTLDPSEPVILPGRLIERDSVRRIDGE